MPRNTAGPRTIDGAPAPFFEKLLGGAHGAAAGRLYTGEELAVAVSNSIADLLATRAADDVAARAPRVRLVTDYGAPSLEQFAPARAEDRARLARALRDAIAAFEPRLENPEVVVSADPSAGARLQARITGWLRLGRTLEPFEFTAPLASPHRSHHGD